MKLVIKHLGSLQHAEIDLSKRFYLFTGYNNTGKTYVTKLLYALFQRETLQGFLSKYEKSIEPLLSSALQTDIDSIELENDMVQTILANFGQYLKEDTLPAILKLKKDHFIIKNTKISFEFSLEELKNKSLTSFTSNYTNNGSTLAKFATLHKPENSLTATFSYQSQENFEENFQKALKDVTLKNMPRFFNMLKMSAKITLPAFVVDLLLQIKETSFFLPANRGFLLENASDFLELKNKRNDKVLQDFLETIEGKNVEQYVDDIVEIIDKMSIGNYPSDIDFLFDKISELRSAKDEAEIQGNNHYITYLQKMQDIMGGAIVMEKAHSLGYWTERFKMQGVDNEESINLYLASSSANQLALLFQFFKYWAKPEHNFLMIDEPEINLHPENQIKLVNMLLSFVGEKHNRLLLTTHSPMIAEMISNYLNLSFLKKQDIAISEELENMPYFDTKITLNEEEVGIYAFHGDNVEEYKRQDYGIVYKNINKEVNKVANIASYLTDSIYQLENA